eukprot:CAMPEP_0116909982 /NCGR_PEP_ID=MMETSP0467-20121206/14602_1 /TAXON_ID=283647 /ORGANISM="Mesodinium pulex, Strain SPMC105" /LENGTH=72 /DNA_ID=CAMNT_0004585449 /DNA_START=1163 /DNA_END=1381 /DNA_ORIENTATION=-
MAFKKTPTFSDYDNQSNSNSNSNAQASSLSEEFESKFGITTKFVKSIAQSKEMFEGLSDKVEAMAHILKFWQ